MIISLKVVGSCWPHCGSYVTKFDDFRSKKIWQSYRHWYMYTVTGEISDLRAEKSWEVKVGGDILGRALVEISLSLSLSREFLEVEFVRVCSLPFCFLPWLR